MAKDLENDLEKARVRTEAVIQQCKVALEDYHTAEEHASEMLARIWLLYDDIEVQQVWPDHEDRILELQEEYVRLGGSANNRLIAKVKNFESIMKEKVTSIKDSIGLIEETRQETEEDAEFFNNITAEMQRVADALEEIRNTFQRETA
ncbi:TPA: hypothetical protein H1011_01940 [archaeon]|jgi:hypothetical protein|uniref:Uncharacterized protein n=1 Tax=Candidatus Undinarchaeum marinum TaxID=2756141 RepID=A0A832V8H5_9ARCH|nr:hypothetical protein [Candidatus Undinarchaeum marinum]